MLSHFRFESTKDLNVRVHWIAKNKAGWKAGGGGNYWHLGRVYVQAYGQHKRKYSRFEEKQMYYLLWNRKSKYYCIGTDYGKNIGPDIPSKKR